MPIFVVDDKSIVCDHMHLSEMCVLCEQCVRFRTDTTFFGVW